MMDVLEAPARLFNDFDLEAQVPANHMLRQIDRALQFRVVHLALQSHYSHLGRPSIDPKLIARMLVIGYTLGIRSEWRLCKEGHHNLAYRWFCRLGSDGKMPDRSTFSKYRHGKFRESELLRVMFEAAVARRISEGRDRPRRCDPSVVVTANIPEMQMCIDRASLWNRLRRPV